ncbi:MAG: hypothetical protein NC331_12935 [Lachnospiraceae bacterium]|nr:hypothetical protein [Lachnospiraceae bacterium]MCM1240270.1 hypothetical protein [Lachnospiraceae bacterium]
MSERIKEGFGSICKKPLNIVLSALMVTFMSVLSILAWDGIAKRLVICVGLTVISGLLLLLPRMSNRITVPLLAIYLFYVPVKIFQRMELPICDMSSISDGVEEATVAFIICAYLLVFLFTQNSAVALGAGSGFFLILFLVEYYIWKFRGDFLMPSDLGAAGTAISVMGHYDYSLSSEAMYSVIYFLFFIVLGARIRIRMHKWVHIGISALAVLLTGIWYHVVTDTSDPLKAEVNYWNMCEARVQTGACLSFFLMLRDNRVDIPIGYSDKMVAAIAKAAVTDHELGGQNGNRISSWS